MMSPKVPATLAAISLALHFGWEMLQGGLYEGMAAMPFSVSTGRCFRASIMDVIIMLTVYLVAAAAARSMSGPLLSLRFAVLFVVLGLLATAAIERWAIATGRWQYTPSMPTLWGIGLSPLLQWILIPTAAIAACRRLTTASVTRVEGGI